MSALQEPLTRGNACAGPVVAGGRGWRDRAACRTQDPELFFPVGESGAALEQVAAAKSVCAGCPVRAQCLSFALVALPDGVAGGLSAQERRGRRARRDRASESPAAGVAGVALPGGVDGRVVAELMAGC